MGTVWRAEDLRLGAPVAVKLIHQRDVNDAETLARFEAEAEIAAQLRSPHVVQVFDAGVDRETGAPYIAMELLEGESLRERLARVRSIAPVALVQIVSQVARALTRAHELGIIHRDLKPANVFLLRDGDVDVVKVLDFGIAKRSHSSRPEPTVTGDMLGTPTYMSPEQILSSKDVDRA
ncbi:MAG: serine/threonine-protein kinase [Deltaproteobacteria bacterium]